MQVIAEGYDPNIGYLHSYRSDRPTLVFDLMCPQRPIVDRAILKFLQSYTFHPADFTIQPDGVCGFNPEMAGRVVSGPVADLFVEKSVGVAGFGPATPSSRTRWP